MPFITIDGPRLGSMEKKRELVRKLTAAAHEVYGIAREHIDVIIMEHDLDNISSGGMLFADQVKK